MTQKTLKLEHPGTHAPSAAQVADALELALAADGVVAAGEPKITKSKITSGGPSELVVEVEVEVPQAPADEDQDRPRRR